MNPWETNRRERGKGGGGLWNQVPLEEGEVCRLRSQGTQEVGGMEPAPEGLKDRRPEEGTGQHLKNWL